MADGRHPDPAGLAAAADRLHHSLEAAHHRTARIDAALEAAHPYTQAGEHAPTWMLAWAALTAGPATTAEVLAAVRLADQRVTGPGGICRIHQVLLGLEAAGRVSGIRSDAVVLWVLRERPVPA